MHLKASWEIAQHSSASSKPAAVATPSHLKQEKSQFLASQRFYIFEASAVRSIFTFLKLLLWSPSPHSKASTNKSIFKSKLFDGCPPSKHGINPSPQSKALSALYYSSITACSCKTASSCTKRASHLWLRFFPPTSSSSSSFVLLLSRPVWIFATNFLLCRTWKKPSTIF